MFLNLKDKMGKAINNLIKAIFDSVRDVVTGFIDLGCGLIKELIDCF